MKKYFIIIIMFAAIISLPVIAQHKNDTTKLYYRHINLNHMSPYFDYKGRYPITAREAKHVNHYCFSYVKNKLVSIEETGTDYCWIIHPLLLIGADKIVYSYQPGKIIARYYDASGKPTSNYKGVYIEETSLNNKGRKVSLKYFDYKNKPMQNVWNIAEYDWAYRDSLVIEYRKNLKGEYVSVAPYFPFNISGFKIDNVHHTIAHYNLDKNFKVINSPENIAYYIDRENAKGDQLNWQYFDAAGKQASPYRYNLGENIFDKNGAIIKMNFYIGNKLVSYRSFQYDSCGTICFGNNVWYGKEQPMSGSTLVTKFSIKNEVKPAKIDTALHTIEAYVSQNADLSYLVPIIVVAPGAAVHPSSGIPVDFSKGKVVYNVIAQNIICNKNWVVSVKRIKK